MSEKLTEIFSKHAGPVAGGIGGALGGSISGGLVGAPLGALAGAITAPEGQRGEGALQGAGYGALGGAGAGLLGGVPLGAMGARRSEKAFADIDKKLLELERLERAGEHVDPREFKNLEQEAFNEAFGGTPSNAEQALGAATSGGILGGGIGGGMYAGQGIKEEQKKASYPYALGARFALAKLGMDYQEMGEVAEDPAESPEGAPPLPMDEQEVPEELIAELLAAEGEQMPTEEGQALTADAFTQFAQSDGTAEEADPNKEMSETPDEDSKPHWSGKSSLEAGDAGTRNHEMGLPTFGGV